MAKCGLRKIDMWGGAPHYCRLDHNSSREAAQKIAGLRSMMEDRGMEVVIYTPETLGYPFSYSTPDFALRSRTIDFMKYAMEDALAALAVLGYPRAVAAAALQGVDTAGMATDEIVRAALKRLF